MTDPRDDLDGGETTYRLEARARSALASIRRAHPSGSVLIVGHFLTNQMILGGSPWDPGSAGDGNQPGQRRALSGGVESRERVTWKLITRARLGDL